ncbi:MAG: outer membrane lipoprotein-sorting protein [Fimbriimonadaceae bacterium]|nr:outer membrane lipoprotein-sorting protein [Fimbriimonadaceae bacterium]
MFGTAIAFLTLAAPVQAPSLDDILAPGFEDATFTARVSTANQRELGKINKDFANSYRFNSTKVFVKEPFMLRLEATVDDTDILFILNGTTRIVRVPRAKISQRENLAKAPGKRQTLLDFGLLTRSMFNGLFEAKYVRTDRATGDYVFDITYLKAFDDTSRSRVWVDPDKRYITKREWYSQPGRQLATFFYDNPIRQGSTWFPTKLTVKNVDNRVAGVTDYVGVKLNGGLNDSLFSVK